jgi:hypothetical protein
MGAITLTWDTPFAVPLTVLLLSFIMGLQNAVGSKISAGKIRTTHMTGNLTDLGMELGKLLYWNRNGTPPEAQVRSNRRAWRCTAACWACSSRAACSARPASSTSAFCGSCRWRRCCWRCRCPRCGTTCAARPTCARCWHRCGRLRRLARLQAHRTAPNNETPRCKPTSLPNSEHADGLAAEAILRKCVHCGFCTATCPTYQLLGDELDGPRGRIYLMKQVLEGAEPTRSTQLHLDRCLTCRNCESTCPSGVDYGHLVDIGRKIVDAKVPRPAGERAMRWALKEGLTSPLFGPAMKLGQAVRGLLPAKLKAKVPPAGRRRLAARARMRARC